MNKANLASEDQKWQALLARSAPTFAGDETPPYGFMTSVMTRISAENRVREDFERIGLRSLFTALAILLAVVGLTVGLRLERPVDFDPVIETMIQAHDVPLS